MSDIVKGLQLEVQGLKEQLDEAIDAIGCYEAMKDGFLQRVEDYEKRIAELEAALFCINCNGTGRDWDQHGEFDCRHCKAAEIRRATKTGGK